MHLRFNYTIMKTLGKRIEYHRKLNKLSQDKLGKLVGLDQTVISKLERGDMLETTKIGRLAKALMVNAFWLETGEGSKEIGALAVVAAAAPVQPELLLSNAIKLLAEMPDYDADEWIAELKGNADIQRAKTRAAKAKARQQQEEDRVEAATSSTDPPEVSRRTACS